MHTDPLMPTIVISIFFILLSGLILKIMKLPSVVGYILAGLILGPFGMCVLKDTVFISRIGAFGIVLLMFFVGMEMCVRCLLKKWKIVILGTFFQILASIAAVGIIGLIFHWSFNRIILLGFVISLSSTAVVIKLLKDYNQLETDVGESVVGVLLAQDIAVILMILILQFMTEPKLDNLSILKQTAGFTIFLLVFYFIGRTQEKKQLPIPSVFSHDPEYQLFLSLLICFGSAFIFSFLELSAALGAFAAGIITGAVKNTEWVHENLASFRVAFISIFFVSIGMQIDLSFVIQNWTSIAGLVAAVLITNTIINAIIFHFLGMSFREALYGAALLAQIGEFSFVLAALGYNSGVITKHGFNLAISTIAVSIILTVFWIKPVKKLIS